MAAIDKLIEEIFLTFNDFIYRDLFYVVGGVVVLFSGFSAFDITINYTGWNVVFLVLMGYIVGYVLQEIISITGFVTTGYKRPNKFIRWVGKRFSPSEDWESLLQIEKVDLAALRNCLDQHCHEASQKRINRTANLKHVGSSMSSSLLVTTIILIFAAIRHPDDDWYLPLAIASLLFALFLALVNWIKNTQENLMQFEVNLFCEKSKGSAIKKKKG